MPIDIGKKQTIEEITGGRIKKKEREGAAQPTGRTATATRGAMARETTRRRK